MHMKVSGRAQDDASPSGDGAPWGSAPLPSSTRSAWQDISGEQARASQRTDMASSDITPLKNVDNASDAAAPVAQAASPYGTDDVTTPARRKLSKTRAANLVSFLLPGTLAGAHSGSTSRPFFASPTSSPRARQGSGDSAGFGSDHCRSPPGPCNWKRDGPRRRSILKSSALAQSYRRRTDMPFANITDLAAAAADAAMEATESGPLRQAWDAAAALGTPSDACSPSPYDQCRRQSRRQSPTASCSSCTGSGYSPGAVTSPRSLASSAISRLTRNTPARFGDVLDAEEEDGEGRAAGDRGGGGRGTTTTIVEQLEAAHRNHTAGLNKRRLVSARRQQRRTSNGSVRRISFSPQVPYAPPSVPETALDLCWSEAGKGLQFPTSPSVRPPLEQHPQPRQPPGLLPPVQSVEQPTLPQLPDRTEEEAETDQQQEQEQEQLTGWRDGQHPTTPTSPPPPPHSIQGWVQPTDRTAAAAAAAEDPIIRRPVGFPPTSGPMIDPQQQQQPSAQLRPQLQLPDTPRDATSQPLVHPPSSQPSPQPSPSPRLGGLSPLESTATAAPDLPQGRPAAGRMELNPPHTNGSSDSSRPNGNSNVNSNRKQRKPSWRRRLTDFLLRRITIVSGAAATLPSGPAAAAVPPSPSSRPSISEMSSPSPPITPLGQLRVLDSHVFTRRRVAVKKRAPWGGLPATHRVQQAAEPMVGAGETTLSAWGLLGAGSGGGATAAGAAALPPLGGTGPEGSAVASAALPPPRRLPPLTSQRGLGERAATGAVQCSSMQPPAPCTAPSLAPGGAVATPAAASAALPPPPSPSPSPPQPLPKPSRGASLLTFLGLKPRASAGASSSTSSDSVSSAATVHSGAEYGRDTVGSGAERRSGGATCAPSVPLRPDSPDPPGAMRSLNPSASLRLAPGETADLQRLQKL